MPEPECDYEGCEEPALRDSEHCIFHEPEKTGLAVRGFYKLIRQEARVPVGEIPEDFSGEEQRRWIFSDEVNWKGYKFPILPENSSGMPVLFSLRRSRFDKAVDLTDATFTSYALFNGASFGGDADLSGVNFCEGVDFRSAEFEGKLNLSEVEFFERAIFRNSEFTETLFKKSEFHGGTDFFNSEFSKWTSFRGAQFHDATHDFRESTFDQLDFSEVNFTGVVDFEGASFTSSVGFDNVEFEKLVSFKDIEVVELVSFEGAHFSEVVNFNKAVFSGGARFNRAMFFDEAYFENVSFGSQANFRGVQFTKSSFMGARFERYSNFDDVKFKEDTIARDVTFCGEASFKRVEFQDVSFSGSIFRFDASFRYSVFSGEADFSEIKVSPFGGADFRDTTFHWNTSFKESRFHIKLDKQLESCPSPKQGQEQVRDGKKADFSRATFIKVPDFKGTYFGNRLKFNNTSFRQGISLIRGIEDLKEISPAGIKTKLQKRFHKLGSQETACRVQRISYEENGEKEKADQTFVQEMRVRREKQLKHHIEDHGGDFGKLFGKEEAVLEIIKTKLTDIEFIRLFLEKPVADWSCEYGTNWVKVLGNSFKLIILSAVLYWISSTGITSSAEKLASGKDLYQNILPSIYQSITTFTTLGFGLQNQTNWLYKLTASVESLGGVLFTALIIVVFARKWMRG